VTHRGPCQPRKFCDSVISCNLPCLPHRMTESPLVRQRPARPRIAPETGARAATFWGPGVAALRKRLKEPTSCSLRGETETTLDQGRCSDGGMMCLTQVRDLNCSGEQSWSSAHCRAWKDQELSAKQHLHVLVSLDTHSYQTPQRGKKGAKVSNELKTGSRYTYGLLN